MLCILSMRIFHLTKYFSFFSFGAGIVVETPSRLTLSIDRTTNLCFMQYEKQFVPPRTWTNVSTHK